MKKLNLKIEGKECILYMKENENTEYVLIQPVDEHDIDVLDNEVRYISENTNKNFYVLVSNEKGATTTVGSLSINGTPISANENASSIGVTGQSRFINEGTFTIKQ